MATICCPKCGTKYRASRELAGKKLKCKKCGAAFRVQGSAAVSKPKPEPKPKPPLDDDGLYHFADLDGLDSGQAVERPAPAPTTAPQAAILKESSPMKYATKASEARVSGAYRGYFTSLAQTMAFPGRANDLAVFVIFWIIITVVFGISSVPLPCGLSLVISVIGFGWWSAYMFQAVLGGAGGEENLPDFDLTGGWVDDIIIPCIKMIATYLFVMIPAFGLFLLAAGGVGTLMSNSTSGASAAVAAGGLALTAIGLTALAFFVWPMVVLVTAVGGLPAVFRVDLIIRTLLRTLPAYLVTVGTVYVALGAMYVFTLASLLGLDITFEEAGLGVILMVTAVHGLVCTYCWILAMRAIGLYYHHFKSRFAWSWG